MLKRLIKYEYLSWTEGCGCCSNSSSTYDVYEDDVLVSDDNWCGCMSNEEELREELKHLLPFEIDPYSRWF